MRDHYAAGLYTYMYTVCTNIYRSIYIYIYIVVVVVVATVVEDNFALFVDIQLSDAIGIVQTRGVKLQAQGSLLAQKTLTSVP